MTESFATPDMNRREFLGYTSAGAAVLGCSALAAHAQAGANDRISIGIIGTGDRAGAHINDILGMSSKHNVQITAICDVWKKNREKAAGKIKGKQGTDPKQFTRFGDLLALRDVDAVVIATPDYAHGAMLVAALEAGKDVYIEKPMSLDIPSANRALDLAREKQRVVQAGTQYRSDAKHRGAAKLVASGILGTLSRVTCERNFNAARWLRNPDDCKREDVDWEAFLFNRPPRPFDPRLLRQWHLLREFSNGLSGLWMSHYADIIHMVTDSRHPKSAVAHGGIYVWKDGREHTDTFHALLDYPKGFLFSWAMGLANSASNRFTIHGTKGTLDMDAWQFSTEGGTDKKKEVIPVKPEPPESHMENWLECLRSRKRPNADIEYGHQHAVATIMAAAALETGQRQVYDPEKRVMRAG